MPESGQPSVTAEHNRAAAKEVSLAPKTIASFIHANEIKAQKHAASTVDVPCARGSSVQQLTSSLLNRDADASGRPDKTTKVTVACPQRLSTSVSLPAKLCHTKTTKRATTNGSTAKREHASSTALKRLTASVASSYCKLATGKQQQQLAATAKSATKPQLASLKAAPPKPVGGLVKQTAATNPKSPAISPTEPGKAPVHRSPPNFEALVRNIGKKSPTQTSPPVSRTPSTSPSVARAQSVNGKLPNDASKRGASKFQTAPVEGWVGDAAAGAGESDARWRANARRNNRNADTRHESRRADIVPGIPLERDSRHQCRTDWPTNTATAHATAAAAETTAAAAAAAAAAAVVVHTEEEAVSAGCVEPSGQRRVEETLRACDRSGHTRRLLLRTDVTACHVTSDGITGRHVTRLVTRRFVTDRHVAGRNVPGRHGANRPSPRLVERHDEWHHDRYTDGHHHGERW